MALRSLLVWLGLLSVLLLAQISSAYTDPDQFNRLVAFRDAMKTRSSLWKDATSLWTCPTPPANSDGSCDPCGRDTEGNWYHMHCRGNSGGWGESGDGQINGIVTNSHITSEKVNGPVPKEECVLGYLREFDYGGREGLGRLTGPIPRFLAKCFPLIEELDLSCNLLTGTIPQYIAHMPNISEFKVEHNHLIGTIPTVYGETQRGLRRFQVEYNHLHGRIPDTFKSNATSQSITQFHIAHNDFEGDLSMMTNSHLTTVTVHENPKLFGMVPASVRYAKGYNPAFTGLGKPCPA